MNKRPSFPIKFKIIILTTIILVGSIVFYTYFASNLFEEDKKAYIFESSLANTNTISSEVTSITKIILLDSSLIDYLQ